MEGSDAALLQRLAALADEGRIEEVERAALQRLRGGEPPAPETAADLWRFVAWARLERGDPAGALGAARKGEDALLEGRALLQLWRLEEARETLLRVEGPDAEDRAEAAWYLGVVAEYLGEDPAPAYARAAALAPDLYPVPVRLEAREVDAILRAAIEALPESVRRALEDLRIEVHPLPRPGTEADPLALGLYVGRDRLQRSVEDGPDLPPRIEIYQRNIERLAEDRARAADELRITLLHEIAHHLGYSEPGVADLGLE